MTYRSGSSPSFSCLRISCVPILREKDSLDVLGVLLVGHLGLVGPDTSYKDTGNADVEAEALAHFQTRVCTSLRDLPPQISSLYPLSARPPYTYGQGATYQQRVVGRLVVEKQSLQRVRRRR